MTELGDLLLAIGLAWLMGSLLGGAGYWLALARRDRAWSQRC